MVKASGGRAFWIVQVLIFTNQSRQIVTRRHSHTWQFSDREIDMEHIKDTIRAVFHDIQRRYIGEVEPVSDPELLLKLRAEIKQRRRHRHRVGDRGIV